MNPLSHLTPTDVFTYFGELCAIPHGSGNLDAIAAYCVDFAEKHSLAYHRDSYNNVVIYKPATKGYENAPTMVLQGHLDMVCVAAPGKTIDFTNESITPYVDGDLVRAEGTSLGGDNGIAVAMILAILADETLPHPELEALFTADEETGMDGAVGLEPALIKGRLLLNLDSECEGVFTVGCAGGVRSDVVLPIQKLETEALVCTLTVSGLLGGHSGVEIHKGRGNALHILGRVLCRMAKLAPFGILSLQGGSADNAIPASAAATLAVSPEHFETLLAVSDETATLLKNELASTDKDIELRFSKGEKGKLSATSPEQSAHMAKLLFSLPTGVQRMSAELEGLVETSLNVGMLSMTDTEMHITLSLRSAVASSKEELSERLCCLAEAFGASISFRSSYPAWEYKRDSALRELAVKTYRELSGKEPVIEIIHAGLECGLFSEKLPGLDCVSIGPDMSDIHSPDEALSVSSSERTYKLVTKILKNCR